MTVDIEQIKREVFKTTGYDETCYPYTADALDKAIDYLHSRGYLGGVPEWQPIETAPQGVWILAATRYGVNQVCWHSTEQSWVSAGQDKYKCTHWMPLPAAPKGETK